VLAYKFRGPEQIEFALDMLFKNRLYCADWSSLNDPMEGAFVHGKHQSDKTDYSRILTEIEDHKSELRVCSLSTTFDCHLLWGHYANGFRGLAIEVDLPDDAPEVVQVQYGDVFGYVRLSEDIRPEIEARAVLSSKYVDWSYEQEVRILQTAPWYKLEVPIKRIIVGHLMNKSLFDGLRIICEHKGIEINRTGIGDTGIDADSVPLLGEPW
jgi:hypothetical protein